MKNLQDLLHHEIQDLVSAEEQIIAAMPKMINKTNNEELRQALEEHMQVTERQRERLNQVQELMLQNNSGGQKKGGLAGLFSGKGQKCLGMEGIIKEGEKVLGENMTPEVTDAAIIACAQKIEHYEICGYGTARAYARELNLDQVAELLEETLDEEYEADDRLTDLAVGRVNERAERGGSSGGSFEMEEEEAGTLQMASGKGRSGSTSGRGSGSGSGSTGRNLTSGRSTAGNAGGTAGSKAPASKTTSARTGTTGTTRSASGTGRTGSTGTGSPASKASGRNTGSDSTRKTAAKKSDNPRGNSNGGGRGASRGR